MSEKKEPTPEYSKLWPSKRLFVAILLILGFVNCYTLRGNLSIAIVEMTLNKTIRNGNETIHQTAEFNWSQPTKGLVLSMFAYGYLCSGIGGYLATKFGGATIYGVGILVTAFMTLITPFNLRFNFYFFLAGRVIEGVFESFTYASTSETLARWSPVNERSTLISSSFSGIYIGTSLTYPICGFLAHTWGWPVVFYVTGLIALLWCVVWFLFVSNEPATDKWISKKELAYIQKGVDCAPREEIGYPWKAIFMSGPVWALCISKFAFSAGFTILGQCFPLYVRDVTKSTTDVVGLISAIPSVISIFVIPTLGRVIDYVQRKSNWSPSQIHKFIMCTGFFLASAILFCIPFLQNFRIISMLSFVIIQTSLSFTFLILQIVPIYLAPYHCSVIAGMTGFWFTVCTIIAPTTIGYLVKNQTIEEWNICFVLTGCITVFGGISYYLLGSSELQWWAKTNTDRNDTYKKTEDGLLMQYKVDT